MQCEKPPGLIHHGLCPKSWRQAAARGLLARATRVELPHEHSAAAAPAEHSQAAAGGQPGEPEGRACTEPGIHAPIRVEPARGCVTTLEAVARCACRSRVKGRCMVRVCHYCRGKFLCG